MKDFLDDFRTFFKSFGCAAEGILFAVRTQRNFRIQLLIAAAVFLVGRLLGLSRQEWILLLLTLMVVFLAELLNTALEFTTNLVEIRQHPVVRRAKDIAAGAVLVTALGAVGVGALLFGPKLCLLWGLGR